MTRGFGLSARVSVVLGIVVMIAAGVGFFILATLLNPPAYAVVVAVRDIPAGSVISADAIGIDDQRISPQVANVLVLESDKSKIIGGVVVQNIYAFQPLPRAAVLAANNPAAKNRLSLFLTDPGLVAMTIPASRETAPGQIAVGDWLDINFSVGSATFLAGSLSAAPTPFPFQPLPNVFVTQPALSLPPTPTATAEPRLTLPVSKVIVHAARVLSVVFDEVPNPAYAGPTSSEPATIQGRMIALVVAVPVEAQEVVQFGAVNGALRVSILSPGKDWSTEAPRKPTLGMAWDDLVALIRMDRERVLATQFPNPNDVNNATLVGPGASAIEATRNTIRLNQQRTLNAPKATETAVGTSGATAAPTATLTATATRRP